MTPFLWQERISYPGSISLKLWSSLIANFCARSKCTTVWQCKRILYCQTQDGYLYHKRNTPKIFGHVLHFNITTFVARGRARPLVYCREVFHIPVFLSQNYESLFLIEALIRELFWYTNWNIYYVSSSWYGLEHTIPKESLTRVLEHFKTDIYTLSSLSRMFHEFRFHFLRRFFWTIACYTTVNLRKKGSIRGPWSIIEQLHEIYNLFAHC